ncbi:MULTISPECIES: Flp family type IVb pilin [unclassified Limnobacter]|uniref:Flp family type IVb pilin n=1 Tax=unclassified Limnobacter TaxID=2630203 RepID=UPI000C399A5F|nr:MULTISPECIES: Flp family type IVb pilin [unclassified Limnobacter]MAZ08128.1 Flp family type IVb pilin [Sutterellaceae bacterium]|tara:strand:+ start:3353 stop:3550 length:198 start_codon:yes stop_codon:yes gene_type:complete
MSKAANKQLVLKRKEEGASLIEYAVIAALVVALAVAGFSVLGDGLGDAFSAISNLLTGSAGEISD